MDFLLSEEQEILKKTARAFLRKECPKSLVREMEKDDKGYSPELYRKMAELGWHSLCFAPEYGGAGATFLTLGILLEEMGRACLSGPYFSTVVLGGLTLMDIGSESQKKQFLPQVARGEMMMTFAYTEPSGKYDASGINMRAIAKDEYYLLEGIKLFVPDAHISDWMIVAARTKESEDIEEGISLFILDRKTPGISATPLKTIAKDKQCEVLFENVSINESNLLGALNSGWPAVERTRQRAAVAKCCEMIGGAQQVLEMTVAYAKIRHQFGRPIGSFQAVQHHCANMLIDVDSARFVTYQAAWKLGQGLLCRKETAIAKAYVGEAYRRVTALGHQIHGGISFTMEHDMQLFSRRAKAGELAYGDADFYHSVIAQEIGL